VARPWIRKPPPASAEEANDSAGRWAPRTRSAAELVAVASLPARSSAPAATTRTVPCQVEGTLMVALQMPSVAVPEVRVSTGRSWDRKPGTGPRVSRGDGFMSCGLSTTPDGSVTRIDTRTGTTASPRTATVAREKVTWEIRGGELSAELPARAGGAAVATSAPDRTTARVR
jgi:hypothetical protein